MLMINQSLLRIIYKQCSTASSSLSPPSLALSAFSTTFSTLSSSLSSSSTSSPGPSTTSASSGTFSPRRHWFNFSLFFQTCCFFDIMIGCFLRKLLLIRIIITQYNTTKVSCDNQHQSQNLLFVLQENLSHFSGLCRLPKPFVCSYTLNLEGDKQTSSIGWYLYKGMHFSHSPSCKSLYRNTLLCCLSSVLAQPVQSRFVQHRLTWNSHPYLWNEKSSEVRIEI